MPLGGDEAGEAPLPSAEPPPSSDVVFFELPGAGDLAPGEKRAFDVAGKSVLVCNAGGEIFAVVNECTHAAVPLLPGRLRGCILECPLHGGRFDLRDGRPVAGPPRRTLTRLEVRRADGRVAVRLPRG